MHSHFQLTLVYDLSNKCELLLHRLLHFTHRKIAPWCRVWNHWVRPQVQRRRMTKSSTNNCKLDLFNLASLRNSIAINSFAFFAGIGNSWWTNYSMLNIGIYQCQLLAVKSALPMILCLVADTAPPNSPYCNNPHWICCWFAKTFLLTTQMRLSQPTQQLIWICLGSPNSYECNS